ncbi:hypothetical protein NMD1_01434 [Novosphingobium sp. MD-1]|nr:hypothetical protein NMD1_01434 [Novosphingobium sp. MD-1]
MDGGSEKPGPAGPGDFLAPHSGLPVANRPNKRESAVFHTD